MQLPFAIEPSERFYKRLTLIAALFMLLPLPVMQYLGEEGLMALKSYEMHVRGDWLHPSILGSIWPHSPFWHWPVMLISNLIGWEHVDIAVRLTSVMASWCSAAIAFFSARWLFAEAPSAGWMTALVYLGMGEVAFWYGWLGYVDATFGMFIFGSLMFLWRAIADEHRGWLYAALFMLSCAFLTKNITAYAFFCFTGLILLWRLQRWHLLLRPTMLLPALAAFSVPWLWQSFVVISSNTATTSINDALRNFIGYGLLQYLKHWLTFPLLFIGRAMPVSLLLIWLWLVKKERFQLDARLTTLLLILVACILPFWVSASATPRYLVPFYGPFALLITGLMLQLGPQRLRQALMLITLFVLLKIPYSFAALPYIKDWRPHRDSVAVAQEVMQLVKAAPLYTQNDIAPGLAVAAYLDVWRQDQPPIYWYSNQPGEAYIMAEVATPELGRLVKSWPLRGNTLYLYHRQGGETP